MPGSASSALIAAQAGSREALGEALDRCRPYLLHLAQHALGPALQAKGGASDLVQDTFLEAHRQFPKFQGDSALQLRAWLRCLLMHKAAQLGRRFRGTRKRQLSREIPVGIVDSVSGHSSQIAARAPTPSVQVMADEQLHRLSEAMGRLPTDYRDVVMLRYQQGLSFEEVGQQLGRSPDAARMLWARAVEKLKTELHRDGTAR
jgi:RNA polymerase sigma-70 factor (ECF subfamily)